MAANGCYFLKPAEIEALSKVAIDEKRGGMSPAVVGQPAVKIAELAGFKVPAGDQNPRGGISRSWPRMPPISRKAKSHFGFVCV